MKKLKYIAMAFAALLLASCMGDGYADSEGSKDYSGPAIGNNKLEATNVITISELKEKYATQIDRGLYKQVDEDIKILGIVTGNDLGGNLYNQICLQDKTGGILVCIGKSGLYGELPVGQQVLIDCKGLYIGGYGKQAELGGIYTNTNKGSQSIGKVDRYVWEKHYKIIGEADEAKAEAMVEVFDQTKIKDAEYLKACSGKLMRIEGVTFADAGKKVYAAEEDKDKANCVNREFSGISKDNMVVRTSAYAKFANSTMPEGVQNVTGIFTRYYNEKKNYDTWQILIRTADDVKVAKGTEQCPYTVAEAIQLINDGKTTETNVYTEGIICSEPSVSVQYGNADFYISVDGKGMNADGTGNPAKTIKVFRNYYLNKDKYTDANKDLIKKGQKVVICGKLLLYNGVTPEINSGNYIVSIK